VFNTDQEKLSTLTSPLSQRGFPVWLVYLLGLLGVVYLLNPTGGMIELIPDIIPIAGNIDEGVAAVMVWYAVVEFFEGKK
jgi:uncharacterized membrane protein YkvA (DUF1232 family)